MSVKTDVTAREWRIADVRVPAVIVRSASVCAQTEKQPPNGYDGLQLLNAKVGMLGATDVLVKVHAVSLQVSRAYVIDGYDDLLDKSNSGSTATWRLRRVVARRVKSSAVLGSDAAGEVVSVGSGVTKWRPGDRVAANFNILHIHGDLNAATKEGMLGASIDGVLSTYKVFPSESLVKIPDYLSFAEASTLPCAAVTAYNALLGAPHPLKGGDTVLIEGTGGVSIFALQFAVASGAVSIVLTSSAEKIASAKKLGAAHVINYKEVPDWQHEVLKLTEGEGVHHVIDVAGGRTLDKALRCTRNGGTVSVIGIVDGATSSPDVVVQCIIHGVNLRGIQIGSRTQFEDMSRLLAARQIRPVVDKTFPFENLVEALNYLESQQHVGKVVVYVS